MNRSTIGLIVTLVLCILTATLGADAQHPASTPRIGMLRTGSHADRVEQILIEAFREGLRDLGYMEGRDIAIELRFAEGRQDSLPDLAAELVRLKVDVIVTAGTPQTLAAKQATNTIPIVMASSGDPVRTGLVASLARPGGNITGLTIYGPELGAKRLQLLLEVAPKTSRVAFLWNPANPATAAHFENVQAAARALGVALLSVEVRSPDAFEGACAAMMRERPDAFMMTADPMHQLHAAWIIDFVAKSGLPAVYQVKEHVIAGGLMSYGASHPDLYRRAATYVDKILKGAKPADLPVENPMRFELVLNLKTAKALGLTIPPTLLFQADEVIQ
jgi:putative tryptophan/tyrosine transport system substrate-binding protein